MWRSVRKGIAWGRELGDMRGRMEVLECVRIVSGSSKCLRWANCPPIASSDQRIECKRKMENTYVENSNQPIDTSVPPPPKFNQIA